MSKTRWTLINGDWLASTRNGCRPPRGQRRSLTYERTFPLDRYRPAAESGATLWKSAYVRRKIRLTHSSEFNIGLEDTARFDPV